MPTCVCVCVRAPFFRINISYVVLLAIVAHIVLKFIVLRQPLHASNIYISCKMNYAHSDRQTDIYTIFNPPLPLNSNYFWFHSFDGYEYSVFYTGLMTRYSGKMSVVDLNQTIETIGTYCVACLHLIDTIQSFKCVCTVKSEIM